jgi:hypothetical protein
LTPEHGNEWVNVLERIAGFLRKGNFEFKSKFSSLCLSVRHDALSPQDRLKWNNKFKPSPTEHAICLWKLRVFVKWHRPEKQAEREREKTNSYTKGCGTLSYSHCMENLFKSKFLHLYPMKSVFP